MKKNKIDSNDPERRFITTEVNIETEIREEKEVKLLKFTPIVFDIRADMGYFEEIIEKNAFDKIVNTEDIRALKNHNPNFVLGRRNKGKGTLDIKIDSKGVHCTIAPRMKRSYMVNLMDEIEAGDVTQGSFAFRADVTEWRHSDKYGDGGLRVVKSVKRWPDVSIVTYPAYPDTSIAKRGQQAYLENLKKEEKEKEPKNETEGSASIKLRQRQIYINKNKF